MRLLILLSLATLLALASTQNIQINPSTRHFVDAQGRTRIFHGVNAVYKIPPWVPSNGAFDPQNSLGAQDVAQLQQWGFTAVRLGTMWPGVMPARGVVNTTYLQQVESIVNALGTAGIYSIVDMHQDLLSRYYCGEGMPDWLVSHDSVFKFPIPVDNPNITYDSNGYPNLQDCLEVQFAAYYMSDAVSVLFQELYTNSHNMTDYLNQFWGAVSSYFASNPYVLGYELINEPWAGDYLSNLNLLKPGETDKRYLAPMYTGLHNTIRQADNSHIIFFEPMVFDEGPSGFKQGPGGPTYNDRQALSYHVYCGINIENGGRGLGECNATDALIGGLRLEDMKRMGIGGFMTEFGALNGTQYDVDSLHFITDVADDALQSWTYWQYKFYQDLTTSDSAESFYFNDGTLDTTKVKALSRTYAPAIAGTPVTSKFNALNGQFTLIYDVSLAINASTIIYLNEQLYYPNGYSVSITPSGVASCTQTAANWLSVTPLTKTDGTRITVQVAPK